MKKLLKKIQSFLLSLGSFLNKKTSSINLPSTISRDEYLARILQGGTSRDSIKRLYNPETEKVNHSQFMDKRSPTTISVNRISSITDAQAHNLGIDHVMEVNKNNNNTQAHYHGFAKLSSEVPYQENCKIEKDDDGGKKPFHANIIYPRPQGKQKFEDMEIAIVLAEHSVLAKYTKPPKL